MADQWNPFARPPFDSARDDRTRKAGVQKWISEQNLAAYEPVLPTMDLLAGSTRDQTPPLSMENEIDEVAQHFYGNGRGLPFHEQYPARPFGSEPTTIEECVRTNITCPLRLLIDCCRPRSNFSIPDAKTDPISTSFSLGLSKPYDTRCIVCSRSHERHPDYNPVWLRTLCGHFVDPFCLLAWLLQDGFPSSWTPGCEYCRYIHGMVRWPGRLHNNDFVSVPTGEEVWVRLLRVMHPGKTLAEYRTMGFPPAPGAHSFQSPPASDGDTIGLIPQQRGSPLPRYRLPPQGPHPPGILVYGSPNAAGTPHHQQYPPLSPVFAGHRSPDANRSRNPGHAQHLHVAPQSYYNPPAAGYSYIPPSPGYHTANAAPQNQFRSPMANVQPTVTPKPRRRNDFMFRGNAYATPPK